MNVRSLRMICRQVTGRYAGVAVLAMFTIAIAAGQARGSLSQPKLDAAADDDQRVGVVSLLPLVEHVRAADALPPVVDALLDVPIKLDVDLRTQRITISREPMPRKD